MKIAVCPECNRVEYSEDATKFPVFRFVDLDEETGESILICDCGGITMTEEDEPDEPQT